MLLLFSQASTSYPNLGQVRVNLAGTFVIKPLKVWNGTAWVKKPVKVWNGISWVPTFSGGTANPNDPSKVSGMLSRHRADSITGVSDGGGVSNWPDTAGNATGSNAMLQSNGTNQPKFVVSSVNGRAGVRWPAAANGVGMYANSLTTGTAQQTVISVVVPSSIYLSTTTIGTIRGAASSGGMQMRLDGPKISNLKQSVQGLGNSTSVLADAKPVAIATTYDSSIGSTWYINNANAGSSSLMYALTTTGATLGYNGTGNNEGWQGDILEVFSWARVLTASELTTVFSYIQEYYGIQVANYTPVTSYSLKPDSTDAGFYTGNGAKESSTDPGFFDIQGNAIREDTNEPGTYS